MGSHNICKNVAAGRKILGVLVGIAGLSQATTALAEPFTCSGEIYQVQSGQLRVFNPISSSYEDVGTNQGSYNATGYNILDNFAYGMQGNNLIRIEADGTVTTLRDLGFSSFAGDVDDDNNFYLRRSPSRYSRIDLVTGAVTTFNVSGETASGADIVFVRNGGVPYLVVISSNRIGLINLDTNVSVRKNLSAFNLPGGGWGAAWIDFNGRTFAFNNDTGQIWEFFNLFTSSPSAVLAAQGDPSGNNDGFSCPTAPFPNLPPVAQNDDFTTPFEMPISGNVLINNGNGVDFDPESGPVMADTALVSGASNGSATLAANGAFTYTPDSAFYGEDRFEYRVIDQTGLSAIATVTITIPPPPIDLVTVKTLTSATSNPMIGDTVTFQIAVTNNGPAPATGVALTDNLPAGLTATGNNGNVTAGSYDTVSGVWTLGTIANGTTETLTIEGTVDVTSGGTAIENVTTVATGDQSDPSNSGNDLTERIIVFPLDLLASSDASDDIISSSGSTNAVNVLNGDMLGGVAVTPTGVSIGLAPGETLPAGLTFDTDTGIVGAVPGTLPDTYSFDYQICEITAPSNCAVASVTVTIIASPIMAVNDNVSGIVGVTGGSNILNVLAGDMINGVAATTSNSVVSVASGSIVPAQLIFAPATGEISVAPATPAGPYFFDYQICEAASPVNCAIATARVQVITAAISAVNDMPPAVNGAVGDPNVINAFANDQINGGSFNTADITANVTSLATPAITGMPVPILDTVTGAVSVPPVTPPDNYIIEYRICENLNPTNCAVATIIVEVAPVPILAMTKIADDDTLREVGDEISYRYTVTNNGNVTIRNVAINDTHNAAGAPPTPEGEVIGTDIAPFGDSTDNEQNGSWDVLAPGDSIIFVGRYIVTQADIDALL